MSDNQVDITKDLPLVNSLANGDLIIVVANNVLSTITLQNLKAKILANT